jgi:hypothetical protein
MNSYTVIVENIKTDSCVTPMLIRHPSDTKTFSRIGQPIAVQQLGRYTFGNFVNCHNSQKIARIVFSMAYLKPKSIKPAQFCTFNRQKAAKRQQAEVFGESDY